MRSSSSRALIRARWPAASPSWPTAGIRLATRATTFSKVVWDEGPTAQQSTDTYNASAEDLSKKDPGQVAAQGRRRGGCFLGARRESGRSCVLLSVPFARAARAAELLRLFQGRQARALGAQPDARERRRANRQKPAASTRRTSRSISRASAAASAGASPTTTWSRPPISPSRLACPSSCSGRASRIWRTTSTVPPGYHYLKGARRFAAASSSPGATISSPSVRTAASRRAPAFRARNSRHASFRISRSSAR